MESKRSLSDLREWRSSGGVTSCMSKEKLLIGLKKWAAERGNHFIRAHYRQYVLKYLADNDPNLKPRFDPNDFDAACLMLIADLMYSLGLHLSLSVFSAEILPAHNNTPHLSAVHSRLKLLISNPDVKDLPLSFQDVAFILDKIGIQTESKTFYKIVYGYLNNRNPLFHRLIQNVFKASTKQSKALILREGKLLQDNSPHASCKLCEKQEKIEKDHTTYKKDQTEVLNDRINKFIISAQMKLGNERPCHEYAQTDSHGLKESSGKSASAPRDRLKSVGSNTTFKCQCYASVGMSHKSSNTRIPSSKDGANNTQPVETLTAAVQTDRELRSVEVNTTLEKFVNEASSQTEAFNNDFQKIVAPGLEYTERLSRHYEEKLELMSTVEKLRARLDKVTNRNEELLSELTLLKSRHEIDTRVHQHGMGDVVEPVETERRVTATQTRPESGQQVTRGSQIGLSGRLETMGKSLNFISESIACLKNEGKMIDAKYRK